MTASTQELYFHVSPQLFELGEVKKMGRYGKLLMSDAEYMARDPLGELLRERVRQKYYPDKPSRLRSSFVFESLSDAETFRDRRRQCEKIYVVRFADEPHAIHRVCYTAWSMDHPNLELQAHEFWATPPQYSADNEVFAEVDLIICGDAETFVVADSLQGPQ